MGSLLTCDEAAKLLGVSRRMVAYLAARGELPVARIGTAVRILPADLDAFIERAKTIPPRPYKPRKKTVQPAVVKP